MKSKKLLPVPGIRTPIPFLVVAGWFDANVIRCAGIAEGTLRSPYLIKKEHLFNVACTHRVKVLEAETNPRYERADTLVQKLRESKAVQTSPPTDPTERDSIRARRESARRNERARAQLEQENDRMQMHQLTYDVPSMEFRAECEMKATEEALNSRRAAYAKGAMGKAFNEAKLPALSHNAMKDYKEHHKTDIEKFKTLRDEEGE